MGCGLLELAGVYTIAQQSGSLYGGHSGNWNIRLSSMASSLSQVPQLVTGRLAAVLPQSSTRNTTCSSRKQDSLVSCFRPERGPDSPIEIPVGQEPQETDRKETTIPNITSDPVLWKVPLSG